MVDLKEQKEAFVSGFEGTSPQELLLVCSTAPIGLWLFQFLPSASLMWQSVLSEVVCFWIPMILCQSNLLYPWGVVYLGFELLLALVLELMSQPKKLVRPEEAWVDGERQGYLTVYRSAMLYLTFIAILAVDFHIFPRRFVKTETHGYSLMDLGAASFVVAAGLVSPRSRGKAQDWRKSCRHMLPLVVMGVLRLVTHKELDYQEHNSEYGVHWNFFFTLAVLYPIAALLPGPTWILPVLIIGAYQSSLTLLGWQGWIENAPRTCQNLDHMLCHLFAANREGILGCDGYSALYLISEWIGQHFVWKQQTSLTKQLLLVLGLVVIWQFLLSVGIDVSRRTTNAVFCIWTLLVNMLQLFTIQLAFERNRKLPMLFDAVNRHGLICFIVANLLTGAVNLSINTLEVSDSVAFLILLGYIGIVGALAIILDLVFRVRRETIKEKKR